MYIVVDSSQTTQRREKKLPYDWYGGVGRCRHVLVKASAVRQPFAPGHDCAERVEIK